MVGGEEEAKKAVGIVGRAGKEVSEGGKRRRGSGVERKGGKSGGRRGR